MTTAPVIVYHDNCHDGITALWVALRRYPEGEPYPARYNVPPDLDRLRGRDVLIVDFSWKAEAMAHVAAAADFVTVLDHHKTAQAELSGLGHHNLQVVFDLERSGAGIAWDFLFNYEPRPPLVNYVEDRDLWRFALPHSREVHAACSSYPLTLDARNELMARDIDDLAREGVALLRYQRQLVDSAKGNALRFEILGYDVPGIHHPNPELGSDLGGALAEGEPFAAVICDRADGTTVVNLRSREGGLDVSAIAAAFGGGGHHGAAGFVLRTEGVRRRYSP